MDRRSTRTSNFFVDRSHPELLLARHGELTYFAVTGVMRESADQPEFFRPSPWVRNAVLERVSGRRPICVHGTGIRRRLAELLPAARQWAVIRLIDFLVADEELIADEEIQRQVLVYGMENNDGIPMEVAFTIASAIWGGSTKSSWDWSRNAATIPPSGSRKARKRSPRGSMSEFGGIARPTGHSQAPCAKTGRGSA